MFFQYIDNQRMKGDVSRNWSNKLDFLEKITTNLVFFSGCKVLSIKSFYYICSKFCRFII